MVNRSFTVVLGILSLISLNEAFRILVVFPVASKSHSILGQGLVTHLLSAGHEVVHITSFPRDKHVANLTEINVAALSEEFRNQVDEMEMFKLKNLIGKGNMGDSLFFLYFTFDFHKLVLEESQVVKLLSDPTENFDAVLIEWFFHDAIAGIAPLLQCPLIWFGSTEAHWQVLKLLDEIPNPAYTVDLFSTSRAPLSFWERTLELWAIIKKLAMLNILIVPFEKSLYNKVFTELAVKRGVTMPTYNEAVYNASFLFLNSHPSVGTPFKLPQNAKYIAGYHIDSIVQPLHKDLQEVMNEAKHGVIYFSMGSNLRSVDMSNEMRDSLLKMFGQLKQKVIWKFEKHLENVPSNIHLVKWAPQQSILAHPNLKMFITHGGQLSTIEAMFYAVPIIGIPVMADQTVNMQSVENKGVGITVTLVENVAEELSLAIQKMLTNTAYKTRAKELSMVYHNSIVSPGAEMVHWVNHVILTAGAPHLRSSALHVPWYQKMYLDLAAVVALSSIFIFIFIKRFVTKKSLKDNGKEKSN